jgi:hypothetical protein
MKRFGCGIVVPLVVLLLAAAAPTVGANEDDDLALALALEAKIDDHLVADQLVELEYGTAEKVPGDIVGVGGWGDSGLWTGTYLAAQSFRYATAKAKLAAGEDESFWTAQRDEALGRVERMVDKYNLLVNIAEGWRTETELQQNPSEVSPIGFGGGVIQGERGMLMRACAPVDSPANLAMGDNKRVFGPFPWNGVDYECETAPSRDTYAGTTFGLLTAFDLVGDDLGARKDMIRTDILTLATFLVKHGWTYPRPHGNVSIPEVQGGHDFDNFISPLFTYVPMARLNMVQAARHVAAGTDAQTLWDAVWAEELATQGPMLAGSMEADAMQPNDGYYKYNLHHLTGYSLVRLESDPAVKDLFLQALGVMDRTTGDDINAHFETITYALTGETSRRDAALGHLREWIDYRDNVVVDNSSRCDADIECVPEDQYEADGVAVPGTSGDMRARSPLAIADRPPTDFVWQRPPTQLAGATTVTHQAPGIDYLLPYWMLRYHTEVAAPDLTPFPEWPGPAHA